MYVYDKVIKASDTLESYMMALSTRREAKKEEDADADADADAKVAKNGIKNCIKSSKMFNLYIQTES